MKIVSHFSDDRTAQQIAAEHAETAGRVRVTCTEAARVLIEARRAREYAMRLAELERRLWTGR